MSDIPRWAYQYGGMTPFHPSPGGGWVAYADHVAALLTQDQQHMEQQAAAVAAAHLAGYKECQQDVINGRGFAAFGRHQWKRDSFDAGVKAARDAVAGLPWKVAVSFGPIDCDRSCEHGPCVCSGVMRPEAWLTGPADALAAIDALTGGDNSNGGNQP